MPELSELYQQLIVDHNRNPRNFQRLENANRTAFGDNPLCGDRIELFLRVEDDTIKEIGFQGSGCAISQASASLMTQAVQGKSTAEAQALFKAFHEMVTGAGAKEIDRKLLGKLAAFAGVREFPARVKCANLPWHTLRAALEGAREPVSTE